MSAELNATIRAVAAVLADYKAEVASAPVTSPPGREWMLRLASALEDLLGTLGRVSALGDDLADDARRLDAIRDIFAHFDWEYHDRQLALEAIERIVNEGANSER